LTAEFWDIYDINRVKTGLTADRSQMTDEIELEMVTRGEYHIVVDVWYKNLRGEFLISKRSLNKKYGNLWECTGGSAIAGEDSLTAAMREAKEELGVELDPKNGRLFKSLNLAPTHPAFRDVWLFDQDIPIERVVLQKGETCDAMWATKAQIIEMIDRGEFIPREVIPYVEELFYFCGGVMSNEHI
jgi:8-oxo-dGTP diphosphatase